MAVASYEDVVDPKTYVIGIDIGGTFTDFVFLDEDSGEERVHKTLSTPHDPSIAVMEGISELAAKRGIALRQLLDKVRLIVHGTTVATNAVLTGKGAKTGLLTTEGFRDVLAMRRGVRSQRNLYDNKYVAPPPLVPRSLRRPARERIDVEGQIVTKLDEQSVIDAAEVFHRNGVEAIAICFMHAYANSAHEERAKAILESLLPDVVISISSAILPQIRLYERVSTVVMDAYVGPIVRGYLDALVRQLDAGGFGGQLLIMQSNGGVATSDTIMEVPVTTVLSGPAAGPSAALAHARSMGYESCILVDAGGTSFDASLIVDGKVQVTTGGELNRHYVSVPMIEINAIGAGGGSIAWLDESGLLHVGPSSAGADPGPAAYQRGGQEPTVTDAALVLGYLNPDFFLGGSMKLSSELAKRAIRDKIAGPLGLTVTEAAAGVYELANLSMAAGAKEASVRRGCDPRELPLVVAGGAGAVHAGMIASELGTRILLIPRAASVFCALGMLITDLRHDFVQSVGSPLADVDVPSIGRTLKALLARGRSQLDREAIPSYQQELVVALDMRYRGQHHEVTVELGTRDVFDERALKRATQLFHTRHEYLYGFCRPEAHVDVINLRVTSYGRTADRVFRHESNGVSGPLATQREFRLAYVKSAGELVDVAIFEGESIKVGERVVGPAIVELVTTTVVVPEEFDLYAANTSMFVMHQRDFEPIPMPRSSDL